MAIKATPQSTYSLMSGPLPFRALMTRTINRQRQSHVTAALSLLLSLTAAAALSAASAREHGEGRTVAAAAGDLRAVAQHDDEVAST